MSGQKQKTNRSSLQKEIFRVYIASSMVVVICLGAVFSVVLYQSEFSKALAVIRQTNLAASLFIDQYFSEIARNISILANQRETQDALLMDEQAHRKVLELYAAHSMNNEDILYIYSGYENKLMLINDWEIPEGFDPTARPWYRTAMEKAPDVSIGVPYQEYTSREWVIATSQALRQSDGRYTGAVSIEYSIQRVAQLIEEREVYQSSYSYVVNPLGAIILHHDESLIHLVLPEVIEAIQRVDEGSFAYRLDQIDKLAHFRYLSSTGWWVVTVVNHQEVLEPIVAGATTLFILTALVAVGLGFMQSRQMSRRFIQPLIQLSRRIESVIKGEKMGENGDAMPENQIAQMSREIGRIAENELYRKNQELQLSEKRYRSLFEQTHDAVFLLDLDGSVISANQRAYEMFQYTKDQMKTMSLDEISAERMDSQMVIDRLLRGEKFPLFERRFLKKDGTLLNTEIQAVLVRDEQGLPMHIQSVVRDITERKQKEEKIRFVSFHDSLTGLYNRRYLEEEMIRLDQPRQLPICLIMADLNGLKLANDSFGHSVGDEMLIETAEIFRKACRKEDIIARWGGDEFVIFLPSTNQEQGLIVCDRIRSLSKKAGRSENKSELGLPISVALGLAVKQKPEQLLEDVLTEAENHMYENKTYERRSGANIALHTFLRILEEKSLETMEHIESMNRAAQLLARKLNLSMEEQLRLKMLVSLHDIGYLETPEMVLKKEGFLNEAEWNMIYNHPIAGHKIAQSSAEFATVAEEILHHHERWDGDGYPKGARGGDIPYLSRIVAIVDAYDVMKRGRPYQNPKTHTEITEEFRREAGHQFDPLLVKVFLELIESEPL